MSAEYTKLSLYDAHFHIIDYAYPIAENQGFLPAEFLLPEYLGTFSEISAGSGKDITLIGGSVVSGAFHGDDQSYFAELLPELGPTYVGVTQLPDDISDAQIYAWHELGIRAIRWNMFRGVAGVNQEYATMLSHAKRVYDLVGWHTEIYLDGQDLPEIFPQLLQFPRLSIDHLGLVTTELGHLLALVDHGVRVKATGFGRQLCDVAEVLIQIFRHNPAALLFGSDLPGTRAKRPYCSADLNLIVATFSQENRDAVADILYRNAMQWYRLPRSVAGQQRK